MKGNSHNLMKAGAKRRRTKEEIRQEKQVEEERLRDIEAKVQKFNAMEAELRELREDKQDNETIQQVIGGLKSKGLIK